MDLTGKTVLFLGDSITEGVGTTDAENGFVRIIEREMELKEALNYGVSGTRIAKQASPTVSHLSWDYDFNSRSRIMAKDCSLLIVFGGTNDFGHGDAPFGNDGDTDDHTYLGALESLFSYLKDQYGTSRILVFSPIKRKDENAVIKGSMNRKHSLKDYVSGMEKSCHLHGIPFVNLYDGTDARLKVLFGEGLKDDVHPNDLGNRILADIMMEEIRKL